MKKKGLLLAFISVFIIVLINLISAQYYGSAFFGNYIDDTTIVFAAVFVILTALLNYALGRVIDNKATSGIISIAISILIVWYMNKTGLNLSGFFYGFGISEGFLVTIGSLIFLGLLIFLGFKYRFSTVLILLGVLFIGLSVSGIVYSTTGTFILGLILAVLGTWLWSRSHPINRRPRNRSRSGGRSSGSRDAPYWEES